MKPLRIIIISLALLLPVYAAKNTGTGAGNPGQTTATPATPVYVDPVNGYITLYDTNHDGKLEANELKKMSILDPSAFAQAQAFANSRGELGIDELNAWRAFLKAQWQLKQQNKSNGSGS